jgi:hypothetical protein
VTKRPAIAEAMRPLSFQLGYTVSTEVPGTSFPERQEVSFHHQGQTTYA